MFQKREKYMLFRYLGLVCVIALGVLSTLGSGGGGNGGGGTAPSISNLNYTPTGAFLNDDDGSTTVNGSIDFSDPDGDIASYTLTITDSSNNVVATLSDPIPGIGGVTNGSLLITLLVNTTIVDDYTIAVYLRDSANNTSNTLTGLFPVVGPTNCINTLDDSQILNNIVTRINSAFIGTPTYNLISSVRKKADNSDVSIDYMVHAAGMPKAVLVLIAGGVLNAGITGDINTGPVTAAGGNFLVRSAHLFAAQGYTVITIDRPDDFLDDTQGSTSGSAYDGYRTSVRHAVDISAIVNAVNNDNLPVFILGTSRGAISAVAHHPLASAISLSSPVTTGAGTPVDENSAEPLVHPSSVNVPAHVMWHVNDGCSVSTPAGSAAIVSQFNPDAASDAVEGGFNDPTQPNPCKANTFHGFLGIESCAVGLTINQNDSLVAGLPSPQVQAAAVTDTTTTNNSVDIDLSGLVTRVANGALLYQLPFTTTTLGGAVSLAGPIVTYTPPAGFSGSTDTFVYVVDEFGGGTSHNVIKVTINP